MPKSQKKVDASIALKAWLDALSPTQHNIFVPNHFRVALPLLKGAPLPVLLAYVSHADRNGCSFPSESFLRKTTGFGENAVKRARALLVASGLLCPVRQERKGGKFGRKIFRLGWFAAVPKEPHGAAEVLKQHRGTEVPSTEVPSTEVP